MRYYSAFWLDYGAGRIALSPAFAERDEQIEHQAEALDMPSWLRLSEGERNTIVDQYAFRRPPARTLR